MRKIFGTDGIRGTANLYPITAEVALALGRAIAYQARKRSARPKIIVGKDTRLSCYMIEMALVSGICSMGADALMTGPIPTPGIAHLTVDMRCDAGVMITASHNPYSDNGIKVFGPDGFKLTDDQELEIEGYISKHYTADQLVSPEDETYPKEELIGKAFKIEDARGRYIAHLKSVIPKDIDFSGLKIALDCANGAAYKVAPAVFGELGAEVRVIGDHPNGVNINESGAIDLAELEHIMSVTAEYDDKPFDIGLALDGDADRLVVLDENGDKVDGDVLLGHLANEYLDYAHVVGTTMSNAGLEAYLNSIEGSLTRARVGDRYVIDKMREENIRFGGENSGHIIFFDYSTTGDGIIAALKLLELIKKYGKKVSDLSKEIKMFPQHLINVPVKEKIPLKDWKELRECIDKVYNKLMGKGRVLVRYSGTEMKLRIMVEAVDVDLAKGLAEEIGLVAAAI